MTLVLAVSTPAFALQVSDRLVSKADQPYDELANKSVVLRATDGLLAFGYSGPAFLESKPTDTWMAHVLSGGASGGSSSALTFGSVPVRDVGSSLRTLSQRLTARRFKGTVSAVGWQWSTKRERALCRHVLWLLERRAGSLQWEQFLPRERSQRRTRFEVLPIGNWPLGRPARLKLRDEIGAAGRDIERVEALLVAAIRDASAEVKGSTIGPHCLSILLRPWENPSIMVRFIPDTPHQATALGQTVEVAYTPWLVAPDAIHAPALLVGGLESENGLLPFRMEAPPVPDQQRLKAALRSQQRQGR